MENKFNLRNLNAADLFPLSTILSKIGVKQLKEVFKDNIDVFKKDVDNNVSGLNIGIEIVGLVLENLEKCEQNIFKFLASISGMKEKEVRELAPADFMELIIEVVKKEEFKDFFKAASRLVK